MEGLTGLAALQAKAAALAPQGVNASAPILHDRTLYLDADGLAYYCAGNDDTPLGEARLRLQAKIAGMTKAAQANRTVLLLTGSGSHKGYRYAVARAKPYQGARHSGRPKNWQGLRTLLESGLLGNAVNDFDREADDRFAQFGHADPANTVIGTQDKDMRMVPGWHIDWLDNRMRWLPPGTYDLVMNDKQYGAKWFWLQMLHGDGVDFIPGLPFYGTKNAKGLAAFKKVGEVTAGSILASATTSEEAGRLVFAAYFSYYKERALAEMLEQAVLLWMRSCPDASWDDAAKDSNPMSMFRGYDTWSIAYNEIKERVTLAQTYAATPSQDD